ncbi:ABC transporter substrate-binding protein [Burkholderia vietnamiensis]|uniref:ABC transporter substrate-binding protein n=1 Tax=Burkholderia vietnamiensis TaxID=60552 RepID=UPI001D14E518|nr:ABC transporter substrate-binding protein [Burkholderia vietnamiensis]UEC01668.1 ABC transporter substrate-binding protein [Burkholderia vietnamiensis]
MLSRAWVGVLLLWSVAFAQAVEGELKVLRYAFPIAETGFDPAKISDEYSRTITSHIFESPYCYDPLARPMKLKALTAEAMPQVDAEFKTFTIKIRPGIYFAADPAFKGRKRELTAQDYVYSLERLSDPALNAPAWSFLEDQGILGLGERRQAALKGKKPFDYDSPIEGLRALDRYTLRIRVAESRPRLPQIILSGSDLYGAVAREVVEAYGDDVMAHPVGTGPFRLAAWRRNSLIVLERNTAYRERYYDAEPAPGDAEGLAIAARLKGRRIPMIDRVEVSIIEESQPRWLAFLNGQQDLLYRVPPEFVNIAMPHGKVAPNLGKRGIQLFRSPSSDMGYTYFSMDDPTIGGMTADKVALRRAFSLAWDDEREIRLLRRGQAIPAQSGIPPDTSGYDAAYKSEMSDFDPARANALLDIYGYKDRDGDGWREMPDGSPLLLTWSTQPDSLSRSYDEMFRINMERIHVRTAFAPAEWPENLKAAEAGKLMMWYVASTADNPDGQYSLQLLYGPAVHTQNYGNFQHPRYDEIYRRLQGLPDGAEREALFREAKRIQAAFMPMKVHVHRIGSDMAWPWVIGYRRPLFANEFWQYVDILRH